MRNDSEVCEGSLGKAIASFVALVLIATASAIIPAEAAVEPLPEPQDVMANDILGATWAQSQGYDGSGYAITEFGSGACTGVQATMHPDIQNRLLGLVDYTESDTSDGVAEDRLGLSTIVLGMMVGEGNVGTVIDGYEAGLGVAPGSQFYSQKVFSDTGSFVSPGWTDLMSDTAEAGVTIGSGSMGAGTTSTYSTYSSEIDAHVRDADPVAPGEQSVFLCFPGGNSGGTMTLSSLCVAKNVLGVGSSEGYRPSRGTGSDDPDTVMTSSSRGPAADGRIKPDVVAPGSGLVGTRSQHPQAGTVGTNIDQYYAYFDGAGASSALAAGAVAVSNDYYVAKTGSEPSVAMAKAFVINSATDMPDGTPIPNAAEGWGRINLTNAINPPWDQYFSDQAEELEQGEVKVFRIGVDGTGTPLKITLVYTDVAGPGPSGDLVNDLYLRVVSPSGVTYSGNMFTGGWSLLGVVANDPDNNVENVYIKTSELELGTYTVTVSAVSVLSDGVPSTPAAGQDFALVATGELGDVMGPENADWTAQPSPTNGASSVLVSGAFDETVTGASMVVDGEYFVDFVGAYGSGLQLTPGDGTFDSMTEDASVTLNVASLGWGLGEHHLVYVHGLDSLGNWGEPLALDVFVGQGYYLHVEPSISVHSSLLELRPVDATPQTQATLALNSVGDYQLGTQGWASEPFAMSMAVGGTWPITLYANRTSASATGNLYVKLYDYPSMTPLNTPTPCADAVTWTAGYQRFTWYETVPDHTIAAGNRLYAEVWVDVTSAVAGWTSSAYANADIPVTGTVAGTYTNTLTSNNIYESVAEIVSGGGPSTRYSYMEHKWTVPSVPAASYHTLCFEGYRSADADNENFVIAYSTDDVSYTTALTVSKLSDDNAVQTVVLPAGLTGTVYIRLRDSDRTATKTAIGTVYIDHMYIQSGVYSAAIVLGTDSASTPSLIVSPEEPAIIPLPPIANAGQDQVGTADFLCVFDGSGSSDWNGAIVVYTWTFTYNSTPQTLTGVSPSFNFQIPGVYTVTLTVWDDEANTDVDTMTVTVNAPANVAPTASAGPDQSGTLDYYCIFSSAGSSDPDGTLASYSWTFTDGVLTTLAGSSPAYSFTTPGTYVVTLTVTDDDGATGTDTMTVTVDWLYFDVSYIEGWNFISVPVSVDASISVSTLFADEWGNIEAMMRYDANTSDWKTYAKGAPAWVNDLDRVDESMGVWVKFTDAGDGKLTVRGRTPTMTLIFLFEGWNMIGFPSTGATTMGIVGNVLAGVSYDLVSGFYEFGPYLMYPISPMDFMVPGGGYWVHVTAATVLLVEY